LPLCPCRPPLPRACIFGKGAPDALTAEELPPALLAQKSAVVQLLLEAALPQQYESGDNETVAESRAALSGVYKALGALFARDPQLLRLVHFQGYPAELLPALAASVPAMLSCTDFLHELIQSADRSTSLFGCQLLGAIALRPKTRPEALTPAANEALSRMHAAATSGDLDFVRAGLKPLALAAAVVTSIAAPFVSFLQACSTAGAVNLTGTLSRKYFLLDIKYAYSVMVKRLLLPGEVLHTSQYSDVQ